MSKKLERFKEYVKRVCPFFFELAGEFYLVHKGIKSEDDITEEDWKALMVEYDAANIDWEGLSKEA